MEKTMDNKIELELNRKLAEWAGLEWNRYKGEYQYPFTTSLDAYFKWLVPKNLFYIALFTVRGAEGEPQELMWDCTLNTYDHMYSARAETPALALCLAIEKLIDSEVK